MDMKKLAKSWRRRYRKTVPKPLRLLIRWGTIIGLILIVDILILMILASLTSQNLIDWNIVFSFLVVEVLAAFIAKILGVGQESEQEQEYGKIRLASLKAQLVPQLSHLHALCIENEAHDTKYPDSQYRVINSKMNVAYWVPSYIDDLIEANIIETVELKDGLKFERYLKKNKVKDEARYPRTDELDIGHVVFGRVTD